MVNKMKTLHEAVNSIFNTKWTLNNNFCIEINPEKSNSLWSKIGLNNFDLNIYLKDFELPQYGAATIIEEWINDRYRMAQGTYDVSKISLTFKDFNEFTLYKCFLEYLTKSKNMYFDEASISIDIFKLPDYPGETPEKIMTIEKCSISYVSKITLSNDSEAQIGEFSLEIKSATIPTVYNK